MSEPGNIFDSGHGNRNPGTISSSLLGGIKESRQDAWNRMSLLYGPLVYFWCRQAGLQASDAEDVVQEVMRTVAGRVAQFERDRPAGSFRGWLRNITRNKLGDFIRADRRRRALGAPTAPADLPATGPSQPGGRRDPLDDETKLIFNRVLELIRTRFEERTWRAFLRVVMDGAAVRDVAEEFDLSVESVYQAKSRILRRVRDELRHLGD